jgi:hypothetical protein
MNLSKTLFAATAVSAFCVTAASALTVEQCETLGGNVNLAEATCELTAAQEDEARALGWLPGGASASTTAAMGTVAVSGGAAAAVGGLVLTAILVGDGSSGTTTTTN